MKEFGLVLNEKQAEMLREVSMHPNEILIKKLDAAMKRLESNIEINDNGFSFEMPIDVENEINEGLIEQNIDNQVQDKYECELGEKVEIKYQISLNCLSFGTDSKSTERLRAA